MKNSSAGRTVLRSLCARSVERGRPLALSAIAKLLAGHRGQAVVVDDRRPRRSGNGPSAYHRCPCDRLVSPGGGPSPSGGPLLLRASAFAAQPHHRHRPFIATAGESDLVDGVKVPYSNRFLDGRNLATRIEVLSGW